MNLDENNQPYKQVPHPRKNSVCLKVKWNTPQRVVQMSHSPSQILLV